MDVLTLLSEARAAGLHVSADGEKLVIRGPRHAEPVVRRLIQNKSLVLAILAPPFTPDDLPADWHFLWDERAAIREYDGGMTTEHAEAAALKDILGIMRREGIILPE